MSERVLSEAGVPNRVCLKRNIRNFIPNPAARITSPPAARQPPLPRARPRCRRSAHRDIVRPQEIVGTICDALGIFIDGSRIDGTRERRILLERQASSRPGPSELPAARTNFCSCSPRLRLLPRPLRPAAAFHCVSTQLVCPQGDWEGSPCFAAEIPKDFNLEDLTELPQKVTSPLDSILVETVAAE